MDNTTLYTKLATLPENLKSEVSDFIDFLLNKEASKDRQHASIHKPKFGSAKGLFKMSADFDEPLEDFKEYMD